MLTPGVAHAPAGGSFCRRGNGAARRERTRFAAGAETVMAGAHEVRTIADEAF
jgi:hypothetical protein